MTWGLCLALLTPGHLPQLTSWSPLSRLPPLSLGQPEVLQVGHYSSAWHGCWWPVAEGVLGRLQGPGQQESPADLQLMEGGPYKRGWGLCCTSASAPQLACWALPLGGSGQDMLPH